MVKKLQVVVEQPQVGKSRGERVEASTNAETSSRGEF